VTCHSPEQAAALTALAERHFGASMHRLDVCDSEQLHTLQLELEDARIGVLLLHPGWVRTRMGGPDAPLTVEQSVAGMRMLVDGFVPEMNGRFFRCNGTEIPW